MTAATHRDLLKALGTFRSGFANDLELLTARPSTFCERVSAQEGLQLVWSFVVTDSAMTPSGETLLREVFPDELWGSDSDAKFAELLESVEDSYADAWKYSASEHLANLTIACAVSGDPEAVKRYRDSALTVAVLTCDVDESATGKAVGDVGLFNGVLRRVVALTEVAVSEGVIPEVDQVRGFSARSSAHGSIALDFLGLVDAELSSRLLRVFVGQYGADTARSLIRDSLSQDLGLAIHGRLDDLLRTI